MVGNERLKAFPLPLEIPPTMLAKLEKNENKQNNYI
jgi:hypothetical protein